jgi:type IV pilus assembly protein PilA
MVRRTRGITGACVGLLPLAVVIVFPPVARTPATYAHEMAAAKAIATIHTAETQYYSQFGQYAASLTQLGPNGAGLIDKNLASGQKAGFTFVLRQTQTGYALNVNPAAFGTSGTQTYYSDQNMSIHQHNGHELATANDPLLGDPVHTTPGRA